MSTSTDPLSSGSGQNGARGLGRALDVHMGVVLDQD